MGFDFPHSSGDKPMPPERKCPQCGFPMWLDVDEWVCDECQHTEPTEDKDREDDEDLQDE